jgi:glycosyltransferase involved in cell wall biosynthesis
VGYSPADRNRDHLENSPVTQTADDLPSREPPAGSRRVVHVAARYPPALGGMEKVVQYLARSQHGLGVTVRVVTSAEGRDELSPETEHFLVSRLKSFNVFRTPLMPSLLPQLLRVDRDSIVHLHVSGAYTPEMVWLYSKLKRRPYVVHSHGDLGPSGGFGSLLFRIWKPLVLGLVIRQARAVVVLTEGDKSTLIRRFGVDPARTNVLHNGVDASFAYPDQRTVHAKPRLLFVGRMAAQKNLSLLLHALDGVSDRFETTLVGTGELEADLKATARELRLQNIHFYGVAQGSELVKLYREADVFVLPSVVEGMPLVLLEAMAMGLPIVATDVPGTRDLVTHNVNGLLTPVGDPEGLRAALLSVTSDVDRYQRMSRASRERVGKYSWDAVSAELERIYAKACRI